MGGSEPTVGRGELRLQVGADWRVGFRIVRQPAVVVGLVTLVAFGLRVYGLDARSLFGDEYNSLIETEQVGRNAQSVFYFGILHFWLLLGSGDFWARFPSVVFGVLAVPLGYQFGRHAVNGQVGFALSGLLAVSSFAIEYSQEVRFYSLFLLSTVLSLFTFVLLWKHPDSVVRRLGWLAAGLLVGLSHLFGIMVPVAEVVAWWLASAPGRKRIWRLGLVVVCLLGLAVLASVLSPVLFTAIQRLIGAQWSPSAVLPRGLGLANLAKVPLTLFFFSLGQSVYPVALPYSVIGVLVFAAAASAGLVALRDRPRPLMLVVVGLVPLVLVFLILDPATPSFSETASPRHVMMVLPVYLLLVAAGLTVRRLRFVLLPAVALVCAYSVFQYFWGPWSYTIPVGVDWKEFAQLAESVSAAKSILLFDGRSSAPVDRYFDPEITKGPYWSYVSSDGVGGLEGVDRVVFVTGDWQPERRKEFNQIFPQLESEFAFQQGLVRFPVFEYVFERKSSRERPGYAVDPVSGQVTLPKEIYGLEFQDLALPAEAFFLNAPYSVTGSFSVPDDQGRTEREIPLSSSVAAQGLVLLSDVTGGSRLRQGGTIGELLVHATGGEELAFPLRMGSETQDWSRGCGVGKGCEAALSWHKRAALVGQREYGDAWSDFEASIFGSKLRFAGPSVIDSITIRYTASSGQLHVWGMALEH